MLNAVQKAAVRHCTAHHFSPPESRMSDTEWCEIMGITTRALQKWKKIPEFAAALKASIDEIEASQDPFATCARAFALEQMVKQYNKSKEGSDKRQYLKLIMDNTAHVAQQGDSVNYDDLTDSDLISLCLERDVTPAGMTQDELRRIALAGSDDRGSDSCRPEEGQGQSETAEGVSSHGVEEVFS